ncbi:MAG: aspartate 1-decarboxylase [Phycisphaeraceae bacterium]|nr:aspartate 1-decarboxylase [Phycisphaeraceae bacterium]
MMRRMMRAKIHGATVTQCDLHYVGSITIDADLLRAIDLRPNEAVWIYDIENGNRFETYVLKGAPGSGIIGVNGAAARLVEEGHHIIIVSYAQVDEREVDDHVSLAAVVGQGNRLERVITLGSRLDDAETARPGIENGARTPGYLQHEPTAGEPLSNN